MFSGITHAHSGLRWILLILLIFTVASSFKKWQGKEEYGDVDNKLSLSTMVFAHIQLLLGFFLFIQSPKVMLSGLDMSNAMARFFTVEHTLGMLIAIVLITLGRIQSKKVAEDALKHKRIFIMYLIALVLIIVSIPWPFRGFGTSLF